MPQQALLVHVAAMTVSSRRNRGTGGSTGSSGTQVWCLTCMHAHCMHVSSSVCVHMPNYCFAFAKGMTILVMACHML
jgi:hypothetical protein